MFCDAKHSALPQLFCSLPIRLHIAWEEPANWYSSQLQRTPYELPLSAGGAIRLERWTDDDGREMQPGVLTDCQIFVSLFRTMVGG